MSIVLIIICCLIIPVIFIMAAPFVLTAQFSTLSNDRNGIFLFRWVHSWIAFVKYDLGNKTLEIRLLGWTRKIAGAAGNIADDQSEATSGPSGAETGKSNRALNAVAPERPGTESSRIEKSSPPESMYTRKKGLSFGDSPDRPIPRADGKKNEAPSSPNRFTWSKIKKTISILRRGRVGKKLFRWALRLLRLSLKIVRFDHLRLHARAGVQDPAETGKIYGYFAALHSILFSHRKNMDVRLEPRFMSYVFEVEGSVGLKTSIAVILMPLAVAIVTFPYIAVFFVWRRLKKVYTMSDGMKEA
jgi:hypothetical protein